MAEGKAMSELVVECPTCQKKVEWKSENKYRPFCSDRCHLIDLGEWANEEKRIPVGSQPVRRIRRLSKPFAS